MIFFSVVVPVYNRPQELDELLDSLTKQTYANFEVLIIEDGSSQKADHLVEKYTSQLELHYYYKQNSGQGFSRNFGFEKAKGDFSWKRSVSMASNFTSTGKCPSRRSQMDDFRRVRASAPECPNPITTAGFTEKRNFGDSMGEGSGGKSCTGSGSGRIFFSEGGPVSKPVQSQLRSRRKRRGEKKNRQSLDLAQRGRTRR